MCDDKRFPKLVAGPIKEIAAIVHDGLFTYVKYTPFYLTAPIDIYIGPTQQIRIGALPVRSVSCLYFNNDRQIHFTDRLLMPAFGTGAIYDMFPAMEDIVSQLVTKWERYVAFIQRLQARAKILTHGRRFGPDRVIDPSKDYTKLTLDAIALASMSYRMNSFYSVSQTCTLHLFVLTWSSGRHGSFRGCAWQSSQRVPTTSYTPAYFNGNDDWNSNAVQGRH